MVRDKPGAWEPGICLDFGQNFLSFVKNTVRTESAPDSEESPSVWRVKFVPRVGVRMALLDEKGVDEVTAGEARYGFLPDSYWRRLQADMTTRKLRQQFDQPDQVMKRAAVVLPPGWMI